VENEDNPDYRLIMYNIEIIEYADVRAADFQSQAKNGHAELIGKKVSMFKSESILPDPTPRKE